MKIYGKESDYYDIALSYGQDPNCKWVRDFTEYNVSEGVFKSSHGEFELPLSLFANIGYHVPYNQRRKGKLNLCNSFDISNTEDTYRFYTGFVFFCGKVYPFIKCNCDFKKGFTFYTIDSLERFMEKEFGCDRTNKLLSHKGRYSKLTRKQELESFITKNKVSCEELHSFNEIPVYIYYLNNLYEGGCLRDFQFNKVFDPYTCLQELEMYVSGVLGGQSPKMIEVSDECRLEGKGFDKVTSFRNMKR